MKQNLMVLIFLFVIHICTLEKPNINLKGKSRITLFVFELLFLQSQSQLKYFNTPVTSLLKAILHFIHLKVFDTCN